jgi:3-hydroxyisobutyrate dehydrogenase-like beta-hydroxyacid dehydrogenase
MCGGTAAAFEQARPVFESFAGTLVHLGASGSGQRAKIVNNSLMAANMGLAHAAMEAGALLGIAPDALAALIKASSGRSFGFEVYARLPNAFAFDHGAKLLLKDVRLLAEVVGSDPSFTAIRDVALPFLEFVQRGDLR